MWLDLSEMLFVHVSTSNSDVSNTVTSVAKKLGC
jgi:hypothetical protein